MSTKAYQIEPARCKHALNFEEADKAIKKGKFDEHVAEIKFDGCRYLWQIKPNGSTSNYLTSRRKSVVDGNYVEKQDKVPWMRDARLFGVPPNTIFDGEIVGGKMSSDTAHEMVTGNVKYKIWDLLYLDGKDLRPFAAEYRRKLLKKLKPHLPEGITIAKQMSPDEALSLAKEKNLEGIVIKDPHAKYSKGWTKVKQEKHEDVIIWGYEATKSAAWKAKGWIGALKIGQYVEVAVIPKSAGVTLSHKKAKLFWGVTPKPGDYAIRKGKKYQFVDMGRASGFDNAKRADFSKRPDFFLGNIIEVEFQERMEKTGLFRSPRFNRFRHDKNPWDCVYALRKTG
jgi:ATP-dependent DNA ligase